MLKAATVAFCLLLTVYGAPVEKSTAKQKHFVVQKEDISAVEKQLKERAGEDKKFYPASSTPLFPALQIDGLAEELNRSTREVQQIPKHKTFAFSNASPLDDGDDVILTPQDEDFLETIAQTLKQHPELLESLASADSTEITEQIALIKEKGELPSLGQNARYRGLGHRVQ